MEYVINPIFGYSMICIVAIILTIVFYIAFMRKRKNKFFGAFTIFHAIFILGIFVLAWVLPILQPRVILPYVQAAVDEQCNSIEVDVTDGNLFTDSRIKWSSSTDDLTCYYDFENWTCDCST